MGGFFRSQGDSKKGEHATSRCIIRASLTRLGRIQDIEGGGAQSEDNRTMGFDWLLDDVTGRVRCWQKDPYKEENGW